MLCLATAARAQFDSVSGARDPSPQGWESYVDLSWTFEPHAPLRDYTTGTTGGDNCQLKDRSGHNNCALGIDGALDVATFTQGHGSLYATGPFQPTYHCNDGKTGNTCADLSTDVHAFTATCAARGWEAASAIDPFDLGDNEIRLFSGGEFFSRPWAVWGVYGTCDHSLNDEGVLKPCDSEFDCNYLEEPNEQCIQRPTLRFLKDSVSGPTDADLCQGTVIASTGWRYITVRWDGATMAMFLDGQQICTTTGAYEWVNPPLLFGDERNFWIGNVATPRELWLDDCWYDSGHAWDDPSIRAAQACGLDKQNCVCNGSIYLDAGRAGDGLVSGALAPCDQAAPSYLPTVTTSTSTSSSTSTVASSTSSSTSTVVTTSSTSPTTSTTLGSGVGWGDSWGDDWGGTP